MQNDGCSILDALDAFLGEHRGCAELDGGVEDVSPTAYLVWMDCACGARLGHVVDA